MTSAPTEHRDEALTDWGILERPQRTSRDELCHAAPSKQIQVGCFYRAQQFLTKLGGYL